jgi:5-methylcytosine-specific restriction endonuclease McrA
MPRRTHASRPVRARAGLARLPRGGDTREGRSTRDRQRARLLVIAIKRAMRTAAWRECAQRCVYCAEPLEAARATLDHVHPRARGGRHEPGNVVVACGRCNRLKGDLPPHEFFLRHPWAGDNFLRLARAVHRVHKRAARRAVSLAWADDAAA